MAEQSTTQPSQVATEEAVRPADEHVTTSDLPSETSQAAADSQPAALDNKSDQTTDTTAASDDKQTAQPAKKDSRAERRIKKLSRDVARLSSDRTADQQTITALRTELDQLKAGQATEPEPELKDFDNPKDYAKAYNKWEAAQSTGDQTVTRPGDQTRDPTKHATVDTGDRVPVQDPEVKSFQDRGTEKLGDEFQEALATEGVAVDQDMGEFMMDSDFGPDIYVHLANNPEESKKIFDSSARRKMSALEALEAKAKKGELDIDGGDGQLNIDTGDDKGDKGTQGAGGEKPAQSPRRGSQTTAAKEPPSDTRDTGSSSLKSDPESESMDDYAARRKKEEMRKAGYTV